MKTYLATLAIAAALVSAPILLAPAPVAAAEIKYVVNGEPVTSTDIQRRANFLKLQRAKGNVSQQASEQMIEQSLKLAEMKRLNIRVSDQQVDDAYARFAASNKMQLAQLDMIMSKSGVTKQHFKQFIRTQMGWGQVVGATVRGEGAGKRVTEQEAVRQMFQKEGRKASATEYMLQQVIFVVPAKERGKMGTRKREAEAMRSRFNGCNASRQLAKGLVDVTVRDLGRKLAPELPPEWADSIKATNVGRATPVRETERGVEFIGICSSREVSDDRVSQVLLHSEEFSGKSGDEVSKKVMKDLRDKATIVTPLSVAPSNRLPLALTSGDPAGIGPDIAILAWLRRREVRLPAFYLLSDPSCIKSRIARLRVSVPVVEPTPQEAASVFDIALPVVPLAARFADRPGQPDHADAVGVIEAIDRAVADVGAGRAAGVVTCPITKKTLYDAGFSFPGHTEYLAHLAGVRLPVMMIAGPTLRTIPVTIHTPLSTVPSLLTKELIVETARIAARDLRRRFGIRQPRLAVAGLNPHAGEGGALGSEDKSVVRPAVEVLIAEGINASGPYPADTLFHLQARSRYDAALCMYHDQALIPAKTLAFDKAVNVTLGLPFVRTSPDHGTAFDIAGTGMARPDSLVAALRMADRLSRRP